MFPKGGVNLRQSKCACWYIPTIKGPVMDSTAKLATQVKQQRAECVDLATDPGTSKWKTDLAGWFSPLSIATTWRCQIDLHPCLTSHHAHSPRKYFFISRPMLLKVIQKFLPIRGQVVILKIAQRKREPMVNAAQCWRGFAQSSLKP